MAEAMTVNERALNMLKVEDSMPLNKKCPCWRNFQTVYWSISYHDISWAPMLQDICWAAKGSTWTCGSGAGEAVVRPENA